MHAHILRFSLDLPIPRARTGRVGLFVREGLWVCVRGLLAGLSGVVFEV